MKYNIKSTNLELTPEIHNLVDEKIKDLDKLTKNFGQSVKAQVEVGRTDLHHQSGNIFRAEINIDVPGRVLRTEAVHKNILFAITKAKDEMHMVLKKYKEKTITKMKKQGKKYKEI